MEEANLNGTNLEGVYLHSTNFEGANLKNTLFEYNYFIKEKSYLKMKNFILAKNWKSIRLIISITELEEVNQKQWKDFEKTYKYFGSDFFEYRYLSQEEIDEIKNSLN